VRVIGAVSFGADGESPHNEIGRTLSSTDKDPLLSTPDRFPIVVGDGVHVKALPDLDQRNLLSS
jgi:hypothetical protein